MKARALLLSAAMSLAAVATHASPRPFAYVLFEAGSQGAEVSGSMDDINRAKSLRAHGEGLLYVREDGSAYVIRDAATLARVKALFAPEEALGRQQAELGRRQAALGRQQARLGAEQAALGRQQASSSPIEEDELGRQQNALGRQQGELGRQQGELGRQQGELGRQQGELSRIADKEMQGLFEDALRSGLAKRVD